ncbi:hypothetical protein Adt_15088 [Abeliophyllum distichum]|uniref:Myb/SANT-like domain-containing protein n=1 Tax=Abeliophyllum distichum TaxID=126358 RepID=A0ABD1U1H6_9LAMI
MPLWIRSSTRNLAQRLMTVGGRAAGGANHGSPSGVGISLFLARSLAEAHVSEADPENTTANYCNPFPAIHSAFRMDNNKETGDSHQGKYKVWTVEESNELLNILVDAANRGWRDSNGSFSKIGTSDYCKLLRHSSGFGWDPVTKKFTASDEVWKEYIKSNGNSTYRTDTFVDYEDLRIVIGNGTAIGRHAIALGNDTDARTFETQESRGGGSLDNFMYDSNIGKFHHLLEKRNRTNVDAKSVETNNIQLELMDKLTQNIDKLTRSIDSIDNSEPSCWDIIKEIPNLDDGARFKALDLLNTSGKKLEFMKMTPEERSKWITHKFMQ